MKRNFASTLALIVSFGLVGSAVAQARHDERPHGYNKSMTQATASAQRAMPPSAGARHDEKPHNAAPAKPTTAKSANAEAVDTVATPAVAPGSAPESGKK